ncbi:helix-turn-helix transcriptional regulator [Paenibacillus sp. GCM10028914]|uniref:helix-turn-helix transcriptional regulator n=1 Tax=Paenibacillus sp. GCM10028914 TaxID=3273416 RepID=UPI0036108814
MSNVHRIQWFDQQIREGKYPNSRLLSLEFEISIRQAQRDIEYMEVSLRAPLMYVAKKRGYCYEDQTYLLPLLYMTEDEKSVLNYLIHRYRSYDYENSASVQRVAHLLGRFTEEQMTESFRLPVFNVRPQILQYFELLSYAIRESFIVHIIYREEHSETALTVCPLALISKYNADYVRVYDSDQQTEMELRLDRILHIRVSKEKAEGVNLGSINEGALVSRSKPFQASMKLKQSLPGDSWHGYSAKAFEPGIYRIDFYDVELFIQDLMLHMSEWQELSSPKWLREKLRNRCEVMIRQLNPLE